MVEKFNIWQLGIGKKYVNYWGIDAYPLKILRRGKRRFSYSNKYNDRFFSEIKRWEPCFFREFKNDDMDPIYPTNLTKEEL